MYFADDFEVIHGPLSRWHISSKWLCFSDFDGMIFWPFAQICLSIIVYLWDLGLTFPSPASLHCGRYVMCLAAKNLVFLASQVSSSAPTGCSLSGVCHQEPCPPLIRGWAHAPSQVCWVLLPWKWNLDQRDEEIGDDGLPFHLSTSAKWPGMPAFLFPRLLLKIPIESRSSW